MHSIFFDLFLPVTLYQFAINLSSTGILIDEIPIIFKFKKKNILICMLSHGVTDCLNSKQYLCQSSILNFCTASLRLRVVNS